MATLFSSDHTYIVGEVGPNHDGKLENAINIVRDLAATGIDAVKFQTFKSASTIVTPDAPLAPYMEKTGIKGNQHDLSETLGLSFEDFRSISRECAEVGLTFISTPFDQESVDFLVNIGVPLLKVPSGEITNPFLLKAVARTGLPLIVSTGMSEIEEIKLALEVIHSEWREIQQPKQKQELVLLHCTSAYPAPLSSVNLRAMETLATEFGLPIGYSDHTLGSVVSLAAVAKGAKVIEKHVTPDPTLPGPDHAASMPISSLSAFVKNIRMVEVALGGHEKVTLDAERSVKRVARRSIAAARNIACGEVFSVDALTALRPASGILPMKLDQLLGRSAGRAYAASELIDTCEIKD